MNDINIGIFGDSFAECSNGHAVGFKSKAYDGWTVLLQERLNCKISNYARSGTSVWWSYEKFLENYKKHDIIIFVHSHFQRYPSVPKFYGDNGLGHKYELHLHGDLLGQTNSEMRPIAKYYDDFFPEILLKFICKNVAYSIDKICKENNLKCIQIFTDHCDGDFIQACVTPADKMHCNRIFNFWYPGSLEKALINNKSVNLQNYILSKMMTDLRACHANSINNKTIAKLIIELLNSDNTDIDCLNYEWAVDDPIVDKLYSN